MQVGCQITCPSARTQGLSSLQYCSTANLWPDAGLVNGAQGTVGYIVFSEGAAPPRINLPAILICRFPTNKGPSFLPEISDRLVPVYPVQRDWNPGIDKSQKSKFESRMRNLKF